MTAEQTATETVEQRFKRLRILVPNCVPDAVIRQYMDRGWDDQRIVVTDLRPLHITGRAGSPMFRGI